MKYSVLFSWNLETETRMTWFFSQNDYKFNSWNEPHQTTILAKLLYEQFHILVVKLYSLSKITGFRNRDLQYNFSITYLLHWTEIKVNSLMSGLTGTDILPSWKVKPPGLVVGPGSWSSACCLTMMLSSSSWDFCCRCLDLMTEFSVSWCFAIERQRENPPQCPLVSYLEKKYLWNNKVINVSLNPLQPPQPFLA